MGRTQSDPRIPFQNTGPFYDQMTFGDGKILNPGNVGGGGTSATLKHGLGRIPTMCLVLDNGTAFKGDSFLATKDSQNCTITFSVATTAGTTWVWVR